MFDKLNDTILAVNRYLMSIVIGLQKAMPANRFMVWCRAGLRSDFLSVYTDFFYEPQTFENL